MTIFIFKKSEKCFFSFSSTRAFWWRRRLRGTEVDTNVRNATTNDVIVCGTSTNDAIDDKTAKHANNRSGHSHQSRN